MERPDFQEEEKLWKKGTELVIGIDEVGRGAFAGPIVVGAVIWDSKAGKDQLSVFSKFGINDSKLLTAKKREDLDGIIKKNCLAWDITEVGVGVINQIGIGKATEKAIRKAVKDILIKINVDHAHVLIDGFHVKYLKNIGLNRQKGIIKGDRKSISIAAASIIAKVHRDALMRRLAKNRKYQKYQWEINKGYGTEVHRKMILRYGMTYYHRKMFINTWKRKLNNR